MRDRPQELPPRPAQVVSYVLDHTPDEPGWARGSGSFLMGAGSWVGVTSVVDLRDAYYSEKEWVRVSSETERLLQDMFPASFFLNRICYIHPV